MKSERIVNRRQLIGGDPAESPQKSLRCNGSDLLGLRF
jgi:hypothetical protein